jgi:polyadenylate-binding protein
MLNANKYVKYIIVSRPRSKQFVNNIYVKELAEMVDEDKLREIFEVYGPITSNRVMLDENGKSRGFGFVAFEEPEAVEAACSQMNGKEMEGQRLVVKKALSRAGET